MFIFLDIDGVLNTKSQWNRMYPLNAECIKYFAEFCKKVNGTIILTSTWRPGFVATNSPENTPQIKQLEDLLAIYDLCITDKTPVLKGRSRDKEIERYLYFHPTDDYIILDDDKNIFAIISKNNYFTHPATGFIRKDIKMCIKQLK